MSDHAILAPSGSTRWMACPGSIRLSKGIKDTSSKYASEGTAAHILAERILKGVPIPGYITVDGTVYPVTDEMREHVDVYVDAVESRCNKDTVSEIEQKFKLKGKCKDIWGTSDCGILDKGIKVISVIDLKYGRGVVVEPRDNSQLMIYALGMMTHFVEERLIDSWSEFSNYDVEMVIVQPRAYHEDGPVRTWALSAVDLIKWANEVLTPSVDKTKDPNAPLAAGKHCRFCKALATCPEQMKQTLELAQADFAEVSKPGYNLPDPSSLSVNDIAKIMHVADVIGVWKESVMVYAKEQMELGLPIPGYKLVEKRSVRRWKDEKVAEKALVGSIGAAAYSIKLLTIAQAEKAIKKVKGDPKKELKDLWVKPDAGVTVAPEGDKRRAVKAKAITDFDIFS